jgi:hypothetical protein
VQVHGEGAGEQQRAVEPQVEIGSKIVSGSSYCSFKRLNQALSYKNTGFDTVEPAPAPAYRGDEDVQQ